MLGSACGSDLPSAWQLRSVPPWPRGAPPAPVHELLWLWGGGTGLLGSGWLCTRRRGGRPTSRLRRLSPLALEPLAQPRDPSPFALEPRGSQACSSGGVSILGLPAADRGARCRTGCGRLGLGKRPQEGPAWHSGTASTAGSGAGSLWPRGHPGGPLLSKVGSHLSSSGLTRWARPEESAVVGVSPELLSPRIGGGFSPSLLHPSA